MLTTKKDAQTRFGRRYGNRPNKPSREKVPGNDWDGSAKVPPIAGPMIVPILQTKGITEYARATEVSENFPKLDQTQCWKEERATDLHALYS